MKATWSVLAVFLFGFLLIPKSLHAEATTNPNPNPSATPQYGVPVLSGPPQFGGPGQGTGNGPQFGVPTLSHPPQLGGSGPGSVQGGGFFPTLGMPQNGIQGMPSMASDPTALACQQGIAQACAQRQTDIANGTFVLSNQVPTAGTALTGATLSGGAALDPHTAGVQAYDNGVVSMFAKNMQQNLAGLILSNPAEAAGGLPVLGQIQSILNTLNLNGGDVKKALATSDLQQQANQLLTIAQPFMSQMGARGASAIPGLQAAIPGLMSQIQGGQISPSQALASLNSQGGGSFLQGLQTALGNGGSGSHTGNGGSGFQTGNGLVTPQNQNFPNEFLANGNALSHVLNTANPSPVP